MFFRNVETDFQRTIDSYVLFRSNFCFRKNLAPLWSTQRTVIHLFCIGKGQLCDVVSIYSYTIPTPVRGRGVSTRMFSTVSVDSNTEFQQNTFRVCRWNVTRWKDGQGLPCVCSYYGNYVLLTYDKAIPVTGRRGP
jgi:hypothetical protein